MGKWKILVTLIEQNCDGWTTGSKLGKHRNEKFWKVSETLEAETETPK